MALIKCPECGASVSDQAPNCVQCGCPLSIMPTTVQMNTRGLMRWNVSCSNGESYKAGSQAVMQFHITKPSILTWQRDLEKHSDYIQPGERYMIIQHNSFQNARLIKQ